MPDFHLVVSDPFDGYERGAHITDPELIAAILADERETRVRRIAAPPAEPQQ